MLRATVTVLQAWRMKCLIKWSHTNNKEPPDGFANIGAFQCCVSDQQETEPSRCRPSIYGKYLSTWLDACADVIAAFVSE